MTQAKKILLVEDDLFLVRAYQAMFKKEGFVVVVAYDGIEATEKVKAEKPDLILLDIMLPKRSGFEFLEDVKKDKELKDIPVVILSVLGHDRDIEKAKKLGAADYIVKSEETLRSVMDKIRGYLGEKTQ